MKYLKFLFGDYSKSSRDKREVSLVREMGAEVSVFGKGPISDFRIEDDVAIREEPTYEGTKIAPLNHLISFIHRIKMLKEFDYDVISCHNLTALAIGYIVSRRRCPKPFLVYDAHEFEIGIKPSRSRLNVALVSFFERFLMGKCEFSIVVNDSIADEMTSLYSLAKRPVVVRSTPYYWERNEEKIDKNRLCFCSQLGVEPDSAFLIMYHGAVAPGRGVEAVLEVVADDPTTQAIILGDASEAYLASLRSLAETLDVSSRVLFCSAVLREELEAHVAAADLEMVTVEAVSQSYYYMLPNKFFESIQAEVPIVASDFPETARLIREYDIGELCDPSDIASVKLAVSRVRADSSRYDCIKANLRYAKRNLCWENEKKELESAYNELFSKIQYRKL